MPNISKLLIFLLLVCSSSVHSQIDANKNAEIESVTLNKTRVLIPCPPIKNLPIDINSPCFKENMDVQVSTKVHGNKSDNLSIFYDVSGGKIIGKGENIIWRLNGSRPGNKSITVRIEKDGIILGKTITKTIEVDTCCCPDVSPPCECPNIQLISPQTIKTKEKILIEAKMFGSGVTEFIWKVSEGTILNGQGTRQILVKIPRNIKGKVLTVNLQLKFGKESCEACVNEFSKEILIVKK